MTSRFFSYKKKFTWMKIVCIHMQILNHHTKLIKRSTTPTSSFQMLVSVKKRRWSMVWWWKALSLNTSESKIWSRRRTNRSEERRRMINASTNLCWYAYYLKNREYEFISWERKGRRTKMLLLLWNHTALMTKSVAFIFLKKFPYFLDDSQHKTTRKNCIVIIM